MGKLKRKLLTYEEQLAQFGIMLEQYKILGSETFNKNNVENLGYDYANLMKSLNYNQCCNRYKWKGLPENLSGQLIESILFTKGCATMYVRGGTMYVLPFVNDGDLNDYGQFETIRPIAFNGDEKQFSYKLKVNNTGGFDKNGDAIILYDSIPLYNGAILPKAVLTQKIDENCSKILNMIMQNLQNSNKKILFECEDEPQKKQLIADLDNAFGSTDAFIVVKKGSDLTQNGKPLLLNNDIQIVSQSLFEAWQSWNNIRCSLNGIDNNGAFEKKERMITKETRGDVIQSRLALDSGLQMRKLAIKQFQAQYIGKYEWVKKLDVEINDILKDDEEYEKTINN